MRIWAYAWMIVLALALPATAQDDEDGGMLVRFLENTLSSDDRYIRVTGLIGALSSKAQIQEITVSDDAGVWLRISDAVLDWNRLALIRGRFSVNALTAGEIAILRSPDPVPTDPDIPAPEAQPFQLPELPVSIQIGSLNVQTLSLGEPLIGVAADLSVNGALSLDSGALDARLDITRLDRAGDEIKLIAAFANSSRELTIDLDVAEDQGGLISTALGMPGEPPLTLTVKGAGPLTNFTADLGLSTDGTQRLAGQVALRGAEDAGIAFDADLGGDVTPMLPAEYHDFFGTDTRLVLSGQTGAKGAVTVDTLKLSADALVLTGDMRLAQGGIVSHLRLDGQIAPPTGDAVILPVAERTTLSSALFNLGFDATQGNGWTLSLTADDFTRPDMVLGQARLLGQGTLDQSAGLTLDGNLRAALERLRFDDAALSASLGSDITLDGDFTLTPDKTLGLHGFALTGPDFGATVDGTINGLGSGFQMSGDVQVQAQDLSRFSALAGRDLGGAITASLQGQGSPLGGSFDVALNANAQDLATGIAQVDALTRGATTLALDAARGGEGLNIRDFTLTGTALNAQAQGALRSQGSALTFSAGLDDLARVVPDVSGPVTLTGDLSEEAGTWSGKLDLKGPHKSFVDLHGSLDPKGSADVLFEAALHELERFVPQLDGTVTAKGSLTASDGKWKGNARLQGPHDSFADLGGTYDDKGRADIDFDAAFGMIERFVPQLRGKLTAKGTLTQDSGIWSGDVAVKGPTSSFANLTGSLAPDGAADVTFDASFDALERFVPTLAGTVTAKGTAKRKGDLWTLRTDATGPSGVLADLDGTFDQASGRANIGAKGQMRLDTANLFIRPNQISGLARFDLRLNGEPSLAALSGTVTTSGTTLAVPSVAQTIEAIGATITLRNARADIQATGNLRAGGGFRISGPVALEPPYDGRIVVDILNLILTDNLSFDSSANGQIVMAGPLAGGANISGQVTFGETNINLNAISGGVGAAPIPPMQHVGESQPVFLTRERAGLVQTEGGGGSKVDYGLNILLSAPNKVFARGFGLQAELGGAVTIAGSTARVNPSGQIDLIRGTLDIVGRRLNLTKGVVSLQGDLSPYVEFESSTTTSDGQATIEIAGPLNAPKVSVFADPERPPEEALAMLLFGNRFSELSPFVIAQMAASLAAMTAGGGAKDDARKAAGVDSLDIGTDSSGAGRVGAGTYIADNIYTDFSVNTRGETELNLNLDVTESLTLRGTVDSTGESGLGVFFERDY